MKDSPILHPLCNIQPQSWVDHISAYLLKRINWGCNVYSGNSCATHGAISAISTLLENFRIQALEAPYIVGILNILNVTCHHITNIFCAKTDCSLVSP